MKGPAALEDNRPAIVKPARNSGSRGVTRLAEGDGPEAGVAAFEYGMAACGGGPGQVPA